MHPVRLLAILSLIAATFAAVTATSPAYADHCGEGEAETEVQGGLGHVCVQVVIPGSPGGQGDGDAGEEGGANSAPQICHSIYDWSQEVPCGSENAGAWFPDAMGGQGCNAFMLDPQPPAGSPLWEGHDPSEGSVWGCDTDFANNGNTFFVANGEPAPVDPAVLASRALGQMQLVKADAQIAPGPDFHTYINIDNWMWVPADQWRSLRLTVSAGPTSVTVTAAPSRVEWDMGTETVACPDAGRAWKKGMTDAAKTSCSYAYESLENSSGDTHAVSAQIVYAVTWTCSGACLTPSGDLGELSAPAGETTTIEVRQRQTVVTD